MLEILKSSKLLTLLKSAKKLNNNNVTIKIFGDGIEFMKLKKYKEDNNIDNVNFLGRFQKTE